MHYLLLPLLLLVCAAAALAAPRGVAPDRAHLYVPSADGSWKCLGSDTVIPASRINDDYCDCPDGSDEPGTSACPDTRFYCANEGHFPAYIFASHVDDGLCDPDCCDGSDEARSGVKCPNVCAKRHAEYLVRANAAKKVHDAGSRIRKQYVAQAKDDRAKATHELETKRAALEEAVANEERLQAVVAAAEQEFEHRRALQRQSPLYTALEDRKTALEQLYNGHSKVERELRNLANILEDLVDQAGTPAEDSPLQEYLKWRRNDAGESVSVHERVNAIVESAQSQKAEDLMYEDTFDLLDAANNAPVSSALYNIPAYLPDALVPTYERVVRTVVDLLVHLQIISPAQKRDPVQTDVDSARHEHSKAKDVRADLEDSVKRLERQRCDPARYGLDSEFKALEGQCISKNTGDYTYEFCFLGNTKQISNRDQFPFTLGRFNHFDFREKHSPSEYAHYTTMLYDRGQKCWNGPQRSTLVTLECGEKNQLLEVSEAEKCVYSMRVSTPAVCVPQPEEKPVAHDEL